MPAPTDQPRVVLPIPSRRPDSPTAVDAGDQAAYAPELAVRAPERAPNVVVILVDDMGFGAPSVFGGPCEMPVAERLAANGLRYTRFHTTALCSPTRAALLTGRNHHSVGFGTLAEIVSTPRPGYDARRPASAATIARTLACNGYATGCFGKWHQLPVSEISPVGPFERWPTGSEGFERFYGFVGGHMNHWQPLLFDGTSRVEPPRTPEDGYHLSEDIVDQAIDWVRDVRALRPDDRFFCYLPFGATHGPLHVSREWAERYRGRFDHGWDKQRELTLRRQKELGVVPEETELPRRVEGVPDWESLSEPERRAACALMELYAGFAEHMDAQVGRLVDALEELDLLDDTLIFYVLGDNGADAGYAQGAVNMYARFNGVAPTAEEILAHADVLGGPETYPMFSEGWALAMDTPYQWWKAVASHYGGTRNGLVVHWPNGIGARNEIRHQWHHVIDIVPTILEAAELPQPLIVDGAVQMPIEGTAINYSFDAAGAADRHTTQYFEIMGSRGVYHLGWVACTPHRGPSDGSAPAPSLRDDVWELYDTTEDWSQARDLVELYPERLAQLQELFLIEAARHNVLPMHDRFGIAPPDQPQKRRSVTFRRDTRALRPPHVPDVSNTSHAVSARVVVPDGGADGVICTQGGRFSGWALYCNKGHLVYCHNIGVPPLFYVRAEQPLDPGAHELRYEFLYDGDGYGNGGTGTLFVDDVKVAEARIPQTVRIFVIPDGDRFDVGISLSTTVSDEIPVGDNAFTGEIEWVRIEVGGDAETDRAEEERVAFASQ